MASSPRHPFRGSISNNSPNPTRQLQETRSLEIGCQSSKCGLQESGHRAFAGKRALRRPELKSSASRYLFYTKTRREVVVEWRSAVGAASASPPC